MATPTGEVTRKTLIREVVRLDPPQHVAVNLDDNLAKVLQTVVSRPSQRVLPVVNNEGKLAGVIRLSRICGEALAHIAPELLIADIDDMEDILEFTQLEYAHSAKELMEPGLSVREDARVVDALRMLHDEKATLTAIPVVDSDERLIGIVDAVELLSIWTKRGPSLENPDS